MKKYILICALTCLFTGSIKSQNISGTNPAAVGGTYTYTFNNGTLYFSSGFQIAGGGGNIISTWSSGANCYASITWTNVGTGSTINFIDFSTMTSVGSLAMTINVGVPNTTFSFTQNCGSTDVTRTTSPPSGVNWYWQTSASGTSTSLGMAATINRTTSATLYLRGRWGSSGAWSSTSQTVNAFTIVTTPPAAPASSTDGHVIGNGPIAIPVSVSNVSGASGYWWYTQSSGGTAIPGQTTTSYSPSLSQTQPYYVAAVIGACPSTSRRLVTANLYPVPVIEATNRGVITNEYTCHAFSQ